jgi:hypothetical protein
MCAAGGGEPRVGRKVRASTVVELPDAEKLPIMRTYLEKCGWEVSRYVNEVTAESSDEETIAAAPTTPTS